MTNSPTNPAPGIEAKTEGCSVKPGPKEAPKDSQAIQPATVPEGYRLVKLTECGYDIRSDTTLYRIDDALAAALAATQAPEPVAWMRAQG